MIKNMKRVYLIYFLLAILFLSGCNKSQVNTEGSDTLLEQASVYTLSSADQKVEHAVFENITLDENEILTITQPGAYRLTGKQRGQILVDVHDEIVYFILDDLNLRSYSGPAILIHSAAKVVLTIPEGSHSTIGDSGHYENYPTEESCIFSNSDLTINGGGLLQVSGYCKDAIRTKDVLKILDVSMDVRSKRDGLRGNDGIVLKDAQVNIQCENSGMVTTKKNKENRGFVVVEGGALQAISGNFGISAAENIYIQNCIADIYGVVKDIDSQGVQYIQEGCLQ